MRHSRIREALGRIYDQHPPQLREQVRRLEEDPKSRVFAPLAESYRRLGRIEEAIQICLKGLGFHPDYPSGRLALAKCYIDKRNFAGAKSELEKVVKQVPDNLLAQRLLGDVLLSLDDRKAAIHHYKMVLILAPEDVALHEKIRGLEEGLQANEENNRLEVGTRPVEQEEELIPHLLELDEKALTDSVSPFVEKSLVPANDGAATPLWIESQNTVFVEEETDEEKATEAKIDQLLGLGEAEEEDCFKSEPFSHAFHDKERERNKEITTETLADLYLSQGQLPEALSMLERLFKKEPSAALFNKIQKCRMKLGVDRDSLIRQRQIEALRGILRRQHSENK